jgi:hypothetical protein
MRRCRSVAIGLLLLLTGAPASVADEPAAKPVGKVSTDAAATSGLEKIKVRDLEWLRGDWSGERDGVTTEEHWTDAAGGVMLGLNRSVNAKRPDRAQFEYMRLVQGANGPIYVAQPSGRAPTEFPLKSLRGRHAIFENSAHDFPNRIEYRLADDGTLHARIHGVINGKPAEMRWVWTRREPPPTNPPAAPPAPPTAPSRIGKPEREPRPPVTPTTESTRTEGSRR